MAMSSQIIRRLGGLFQTAVEDHKMFGSRAKFVEGPIEGLEDKGGWRVTVSLMPHNTYDHCVDVTNAFPDGQDVLADELVVSIFKSASGRNGYHGSWVIPINQNIYIDSLILCAAH